MWEEKDEGYHYATGVNHRNKVPDKSLDETDPNDSAYKRHLREKMGIIEAKNEPDAAESGSDESNKEEDLERAVRPRDTENPQSHIGRGIYSTAEEVSSIGNDTLANKKKILEKRVEAPRKKGYEVVDEAQSQAREKARRAKEHGENEIHRAEERAREGSREAAHRGRDELAQVQKKVQKNFF